MVFAAVAQVGLWHFSTETDVFLHVCCWGLSRHGAAARKISTVGGSHSDVQLIAGHAVLGTTRRYIDAYAAAQQKIVDLV